MDKKTECEIVQDLLFGYSDDVLNAESNKLVEKHLLECKECQSKFNEIQKDIEIHENNQKKQIDYLKKIRRRNTIKTILISVVIVFLIFFIFYLRKFIIVNDFINKAKESAKSNNIYREVSKMVTDDSVAITKEWYKDGKYKLQTDIYSEKGVENFMTVYATVNSDERITIFENSKEVRIQKDESAKMRNEEKNLKPVDSQNYNFINKLKIAFEYSIHTSTYHIGREYYVMNKAFDKNSNYEVWIDKDNGLALRTSGDGVIKKYFEGTNIVKEDIEMKSEYKHEFGIVTDEDVEVPDLTEYKIEYVSRDSEENEELIQNNN